MKQNFYLCLFSPKRVDFQKCCYMYPTLKTDLNTMIFIIVTIYRKKRHRLVTCMKKTPDTSMRNGGSSDWKNKDITVV